MSRLIRFLPIPFFSFPQRIVEQKLNLPVHAPKLILRPAFQFFQRLGRDPQDKSFFF